MAKFLFLYRGGMSPETMTAEDRNASMNEWMNWFGAHGDAVVDTGNPTSQGRTVNADGSVSGHGPAATSGYTIVNATDIDAAVAIAKAHPIIKEGGSIDVCETFEVGPNA